MSSSILYTLPSLARTASGNSENINTTSSFELAFDANTTLVSGTSPTLQFAIDRLGSDGVWYNIWLSPVRNTTGFDSKSIGTGLALPESSGSAIRIRWIIGGTSPSFTFSISLIGK
jgi:hypothetical protein